TDGERLRRRSRGKGRAVQQKPQASGKKKTSAHVFPGKERSANSRPDYHPASPQVNEKQAGLRPARIRGNRTNPAYTELNNVHLGKKTPANAANRALKNSRTCLGALGPQQNHRGT